MGLDPESRKHVSKYSLGMRQRLGIAQAIMENPDLLILDEPMNGLDNTGVQDLSLIHIEMCIRDRERDNLKQGSIELLNRKSD